jgi:hypothetical protein
MDWAAALAAHRADLRGEFIFSLTLLVAWMWVDSFLEQSRHRFPLTCSSFVLRLAYSVKNQ